jgi:hypothetical protein
MAKVLKTRAQLAKLLLNEARQSGKCIDLADVFITGPHPERSITWGFGTAPTGRSTVSTDCGIELQAIASRLQREFDLLAEGLDKTDAA